jgi:lysocardiolipin and lysophospholipid acyltransferase
LIVYKLSVFDDILKNILIGLDNIFYMVPSLAVLILYSLLINCVQLIFYCIGIDMGFTQYLWTSILIIVTWLSSPLEIVFTGDEIETNTYTIILANHQTQLDWIYVWFYAHYRNAQTDLKIILKESLQKIPVFGWGMSFFGFIFLKRNKAIDMQRISEGLKSSNSRLWLLLFPEGTIVTQDTRQKTSIYAKNNNISFPAKYVLLPRSSGLSHILNQRGDIKHIYDFTIAFSGIDGDSCPEEIYLPQKVFVKGQGPQKVYLHAEKISTDDLGSDLDVWLRRRFLSKEQRLADFYNNRTDCLAPAFLPNRFEVKPTAYDWINFLGLSILGQLLIRLLLWICVVVQS